MTDTNKSKKTSSKSGNEQKNFEKLLRKNKIDPVVFYSIKNMQQLPDDVIIDFLNAESSLIKSEFKKRINFGSNQNK
jgi:hypothetical protein